MNRFRNVFSREGGYLIGLVAMFFVAILLGWTLELDGLKVPTDPKLADVAAVADADPKWSGPGAVLTDCQLRSRLSSGERDQLKSVYPKSGSVCKGGVQQDSVDIDTLLGAAFALAVGIIVLSFVVIWRAVRRSDTWLVLRHVVMIAGANLLVGILLGSVIAAFWASPDLTIEGQFFWRGVASVIILGLGGFFTWLVHTPPAEDDDD